MIVEMKDGETFEQLNERIHREQLIREHGVEKAEEMLLNESLGELTYEMDE